MDFISLLNIFQCHWIWQILVHWISRYDCSSKINLHLCDMISRVKNSGVTKTNVNVQISISYIFFTWLGNNVSNRASLNVSEGKICVTSYTARIQKYTSIFAFKPRVQKHLVSNTNCISLSLIIWHHNRFSSLFIISFTLLIVSLCRLLRIKCSLTAIREKSVYDLSRLYIPKQIVLKLSSKPCNLGKNLRKLWFQIWINNAVFLC